FGFALRAGAAARPTGQLPVAWDAPIIGIAAPGAVRRARCAGASDAARRARARLASFSVDAASCVRRRLAHASETAAVAVARRAGFAAPPCAARFALADAIGAATAARTAVILVDRMADPVVVAASEPARRPVAGATSRARADVGGLAGGRGAGGLDAIRA